jgi:hypothetical protein
MISAGMTPMKHGKTWKTPGIITKENIIFLLPARTGAAIPLLPGLIEQEIECNE